MIIDAYAKINLCLDVIGKYDNGYHKLRMIMQQIDLKDQIHIQQAAQFKLTSNRSDLETDESNICYKAYQLLSEIYQPAQSVHIHIDKQIPMAAGMAGGSTDAAAVLKGLNQLWALNLSETELCALGVKLGADVPYCIQGGVKLAEGIGEALTPLEAKESYSILVLNSGVQVSTKEVFQNYSLDKDTQPIAIQAAIEALAAGDTAGLAKSMGNKLELITLEKHPELKTYKEKLLDLGAFAALMSGSGPTIFGLFQEKAKAQAAAAYFQKQVSFVQVTQTLI